MAIVKLPTNRSISLYEISEDIRSLQDLRAFVSREGLDKSPIDVVKVAERLGIEVRFEPMDDDMSGFLENLGQRWVIGVNQYHHKVRQRFTIAHELAHFALHRSMKTEFRDETFARRSDSHDPMEREADSFAADLLMPKETVSSTVNRGVRSLNELATAFSVSTIAMKYRLRSLGYQLT